MFSEDTPNIRLVIDISMKEKIDLNSAPTWNPQDTLRGKLQVVCSSEDDSVIEQITVYFEG